MVESYPRLLAHCHSQLDLRLSLSLRLGMSRVCFSRMHARVSLQTAIATALPTIIQDLHGHDFIWAGSAYTLAGTAVVPLCGALVSIFGRKPILLGCVAFFAVGSALAGAAQNLSMLIAARGKSRRTVRHIRPRTHTLSLSLRSGPRLRIRGMPCCH